MASPRMAEILAVAERLNLFTALSILIDSISSDIKLSSSDSSKGGGLSGNFNLPSVQTIVKLHACLLLVSTLTML